MWLGNQISSLVSVSLRESMMLSLNSQDLRGLFSTWNHVSRIYSLFLLGTVVLMCVIPFQVLRWIRSPRPRENHNANLIRLRLGRLERNMLAFFQLNVLLFCGTACDQLLWEIRSELFLFRNPNLDIISPFDGLLTIVALGFAELALIHCVRWWVSIQSSRLQSLASRHS